MTDISCEQQAGIDAHRARYEALRAAGTEVAAALPLTALDGAPVDPACVLHRETVPGGCYTAAMLHRGDRVMADGISAPGSAVEMMVAMDVLCVISNCPQVNNPCNGYQPAPVRVQVFPAGAE